MNSSLPIACNLNAMNQAQRQEYRILRERLVTSIRKIESAENGCAVEFDYDLFAALARFIELERLCCPFLNFRLDVPAGAVAVRLTVTGPPEAKNLIDQELGFRLA